MSALIELATFVATMACASVAWWLLSDNGPDDGGGGDGPLGPALRPNPPCNCSVSARTGRRRCRVAPSGLARRPVLVRRRPDPARVRVLVVDEAP